MNGPAPCLKHSVLSCPSLPAPSVKDVMLLVNTMRLTLTEVENVGVAEKLTTSALATTNAVLVEVTVENEQIEGLAFVQVMNWFDTEGWAAGKSISKAVTAFGAASRTVFAGTLPSVLPVATKSMEPLFGPVTAIGSVEVRIDGVVTPSSMCEFAVMVVAEPAMGINPAVRPEIPLLPEAAAQAPSPRKNVVEEHDPVHRPITSVFAASEMAPVVVVTFTMPVPIVAQF